MKAHKLVVEYDYSFTVLALRCSVKEYKLALELNKALDISLEKQIDLAYELSQQSRFLISNFLFESEYATFRLLKNRAYDFSEGAKPFLVPEKKEFDYLFLIEGEEMPIDKAMLMTVLKALPEVELAEDIEVSKLKSKNNLLF